jgi:hypothetical protein
MHAYVGMMKFRRAAGSTNLARDAPPAIIVEIGDNYARAFTREGLGGCLPDAGARKDSLLRRSGREP